MSTLLNTGTKDIPLKFASQLSNIVNQEWESGSFIEKVTPITQDLLRYWFNPVFCERTINFHAGQKQAILNAIYCHEILKTDSILSMYQQASEDLLAPDFFNYIKDDKYNHPKYCVKMATGTGKTFVLNALLIWQYLNAKYMENINEVKFSKNFLLVAPGLIVYERLLDAFLGKEKEDRTRDFETSDIKRNVDLFIPERYRQTVFNFVQNNVVKKDEIGRKITGEGLIAITNWHLLSGENEDEEDNIEVSPLENPEKTVKELLPITPGLTAGHDLNTIDNRYLNGDEINYLKSLPDICVFNDEAHHIHENKQNGIIQEVEWQKSLNYISENKKRNFIQIDFSATPFDVTGSGQKRTKHYFPHIIVDFDLKEAITKGLVKTIAIDKRKEIATIENENLDFKAVRDGNNVIGLSDGQRLMLRAGLEKMRILEEEFTKTDKNKHPKMLIMCEDTKVSPFVCEFLEQEGLAQDDIMRIDSDKQGSVKPDEWLNIKQKLFNIDKTSSPKVIVSVLMLREGFDVSNVCVIVPLRSSQAPILLEQTIGRGLRLMWREHDYDDIKAENLRKMLIDKQSPQNYLDILSIIEHPAFIQFYDNLESGMIVEEKDMPKRENILGDIINVELKENYKDYDFYIPRIICDKEEILTLSNINCSNMNKFSWTLEQLKQIIKNYGSECFYSEEITAKTRFGDYRISQQLFNANSYNEFLSRLLQAVTNNLTKAGGHSSFPVMQINQVSLVKVIDDYIRTKLFNQVFDPYLDDNWRVLMIARTGIIEHIMKEISTSLYEMQNNVSVIDAVVKKEYFSQVETLKMRGNFALDIRKSIYEKTQYPSNKGEFEKEFLLFADKDSEVERLLKINENYHTFAHIRYIRTDGLLSSYYPDFILKIGTNIYFAETKSQKDVNDLNVKQKQISAIDFCKKINELPDENRMHSNWYYSILDDTTFYTMKDKGANTKDLLEYCKITNAKIYGRLF